MIMGPDVGLMAPYPLFPPPEHKTKHTADANEKNEKMHCHS